MAAKPIATLPNGCTLYAEDNGAGGTMYTSDEIGGGVMVWDTCLVSLSTLLAAILAEQSMEHLKAVLPNHHAEVAAFIHKLKVKEQADGSL